MANEELLQSFNQEGAEDYAVQESATSGEEEQMDMGAGGPPMGMGMLDNPFDIDTAPAQYFSYEMLYHKYPLYLVSKIKRSSWGASMKDRYSSLAMLPAYPDLVLGNFSDKEIRKMKARYRIMLIKARLGCNRNDIYSNEYIVYNDMMKLMIEPPLSRAKGAERERILHILRKTAQEQTYEQRMQSQRSGKKGGGLMDGIAGIFNR